MKKNGKTITGRIRLALLIPPAAIILTIFIFLLLFFRKASVNNLKQRYDYENKILVQSIQEEIENTKNCTNMIILHLNELLGEECLDDSYCPIPNAKTRSRVNKCMQDAFTTFSNLDQILIVWNNGAVFYNDWTTNLFNLDGNAELLDQIKALELTRFGSWLPDGELISLFSGTDPIFAKAYIHVDSGLQTGYILLKKNSAFSALANTDTNRNFALYDQNGRLITSKGMIEIPENTRNYYISTILMDHQWQLVSITDYTNDILYFDIIIASFMLLLIALSITLIILANRHISSILHPIVQLSNHIANISSDELQQTISIQTSVEEVQMLVDRYNEMTENNRKLVQMQIREKKHQERLKLLLLQAQINPHFLYNTLDTIYCLSEMGKKDEASKTTRLLSDFYRHVLSNGMSRVLLSEEIKQTENYLQIQSIRYQEIVEYKITQEDGITDIMVPKLTLQPLVENAIYHGLKPTGRKGCLNIIIQEADGFIVIHIIDDGVGMSRQEFEEAISNQKSSDSSYGLRSVYERVKLYYGDSSVMQLVEPAENDRRGTHLLLKFPIIKEET